MCKLFMIHIDNVAKFEIQIQIKVVKYCNTLVWHDKIFIIFCEIPQRLNLCLGTFMVLVAFNFTYVHL